jgi:hypothetical protein
MALNGRSVSIAVLALGGAMLLSTPSMAGQTSSASISIHAVAPTICRVEFNNTVVPVAGATVDLGQMTELCNDSQGYQVTLVTPPGLDGSQVILDGVPTALSADGRTLIVDSSTDAYRKRDIKLQLAAGSPLVTKVSFATAPKGEIY